MIIVQYFKPIRLHGKTPVRNLCTIVNLLIHSGGQLCPKRYYSRLKKSCGGPNLVLGSKLVNIVRMSPLLLGYAPCWLWQCDISYPTAISTPHSGHCNCCLFRYQYVGPTTVVHLSYVTYDMLKGVWQGRQAILTVLCTFVWRLTRLKRSMRTSNNLCNDTSLSYV